MHKRFEEYSYREGWARSQLFGGEGDDVVIGGVGDNTLWGGTGDDVLIGGTVPEYETYFESYGYDYGDGDTDFYESFYEDLDGRQRLDGGEGDDILIGGFGYNSLYGGAGEDLLVGGTEYTFEAGYDRGENYSYEWTDLYARQRLDGDGSMFGEGGYDDYTGVNDSIDAAQAVARSAFGIAPSADVGDDSLPRVEITGNIDGSGDWDFYAIEVQEGEELTLDIDYGRDQGVSVDMYLYLYDANGNEVARNDDASTSLGGGGSVHGYDSFIQTGGLAAGIYYVGARAYSTSYNAGDYVLNVSIKPTEGSDGFGDVPQTIADIDSEFAPLVSHDDVLIGGVGHNTIYGGQGDDFIVGSSGLNEYTWTDSWSEGEGTTTDEGFDAWANNSLYGGSGNDVIVGGMGDNYAEGGSGNDVISGSTAFEEEYGTYTSGDGSYHEEWHDLESHNRLYGDSGDDVITGGVGNYHIYGGSGDDIISGSTALEMDYYAYGYQYDDYSYEYESLEFDSHNYLYGGDGNDVITGGDGDNYAEGGDGNDIITGSTAFETDFYTYTDTYYDDGSSYSYRYTSDETEATNRLYGDSGDDVITGGVGDNRIYGGSGNDVITGSTAFETDYYSYTETYEDGYDDGYSYSYSTTSDETESYRRLRGDSADDVITGLRVGWRQVHLRRYGQRRDLRLHEFETD